MRNKYVEKKPLECTFAGGHGCIGNGGAATGCLFMFVHVCFCFFMFVYVSLCDFRFVCVTAASSPLTNIKSAPSAATMPTLI